MWTAVWKAIGGNSQLVSSVFLATSVRVRDAVGESTAINMLRRDAAAVVPT
jgi:hypothetical protein